MDPKRLGNSLSRWQVKSTSLLCLSLVPLGGLIFAIVWGTKKDFRAGDNGLHWPPIFQISDYRSLTTYLTIIGVFHSLVGLCLQELASRAVTQVRTRVYLSGTSSTELLNTLPGSPKYFKSHLAWKFLIIGILFSAVSTVGGILYKQALVLSTFDVRSETTYNYTFMTNCTHDISTCVGNMYLKYGIALSQARFGGAHSMGIETTESGRRLTFVAAPTTAQLTSPQRNISSINAATLAMVSDYRNVTSGDTLPTPNGTINVSDRSTAVSIAFYGKQDLDWSVSAQRYTDGGPYQTVRGMTRYCVVQCEWKTINSSLSLQSYTLNDANCTPLDLGFWSDSTAARAQNYGNVMGLSLTTDIIDENWASSASHHDVLRSAYVVPTFYAVLVLGGWGSYFSAIGTSNITSRILLSPALNVTQNDNILAIETKSAFMICYLAILSAVFLAHWVSGLFSQRAYVTEWAPLWFGLLNDSEQANVRKQVRGSKIFESKGLKEIDQGDQSGSLLADLETQTKHDVGDRCADGGELRAP